MEMKDLHDAVICWEDDSVLEVSRILRDTQTRHLIVVDDDKGPVGIISTVDINNRVVAEEINPEKTKAKEIMTAPIECADIKDSYQESYEKMIAKNTYSMPVVSDGKLVGMIDFNLLFSKIKGCLRNEKH